MNDKSNNRGIVSDQAEGTAQRFNDAGMYTNILEKRRISAHDWIRLSNGSVMVSTVKSENSVAS